MMTGTLRRGVEVIRGRPAFVPVFEEWGDDPGFLWGAVFCVGAMILHNQRHDFLQIMKKVTGSRPQSKAEIQTQ